MTVSLTWLDSFPRLFATSLSAGYLLCIFPRIFGVQRLLRQSLWWARTSANVLRRSEPGTDKWHFLCIARDLCRAMNAVAAQCGLCLGFFTCICAWKFPESLCFPRNLVCNHFQKCTETYDEFFILKLKDQQPWLSVM